MVNIGEDFISQQTHLYVLQSHRQFNGGFRPSDKGAHPDPDISSLRSKRFQSSYSAKFGAGAKKNGRGEGEGRSSFTPLPLPLHSFFCSRSSFLYELARNRLLRRLWHMGSGEVSCKERFSMNFLFASSVIYSFQIFALTLFLVIHTEFA